MTIKYDDFNKLDIRIGKVLSAEKVDGADKLIKLEVDLNTETRILVAGIAQEYSPDELIGKLMPILTNLEPRSIRGIESNGMILAADVEGTPVILSPEKDIPPGTNIR